MLVSESRVDQIRSSLRSEDSASLARRRKMILLSSLGLVDFAVISLYQTGVIRHLPDLPYKVFDSDKVNASHKAYKMGLPDGTTGALMYSTNLMLASAGGSKKAGRSKWFSLLLGGVVASGAVGALGYLYDMIFKQKKICPYCVTGAAVNLAMVPLAVQELREEWR